jgi:hypothetical protein
MNSESVSRERDKGTYTLCQNPRDLLSYAALPPPNLLPDGGETPPLAELHNELDLTIRRGHIRAVEPDDVRVSEPREERKLAHELLQRALVRDDRLAREPTPRPLILHGLHCAARAFPKQRNNIKHVVRPGRTASSSRSRSSIAIPGRGRVVSSHRGGHAG